MFIELQSRRVFVTTSTAHPDSAWVTQQGRNLSMGLESRVPPVRFVIHDRDSKFSSPFDEVFRSEGARVCDLPRVSGQASIVPIRNNYGKNTNRRCHVVKFLERRLVDPKPSASGYEEIATDRPRGDLRGLQLVPHAEADSLRKATPERDKLVVDSEPLHCRDQDRT